MKESAWSYIILTLGIVIIVVLLLVQRLTTRNEQDYYLSREIMKAALIESIDYGVLAEKKEVVISKEKFVAVFTRRFAQSVPADNTYQLDFYDIHEFPPKATVKITTTSGAASVSENAVNSSEVDIELNTYISGILEATSNGGIQ